MMMMENTEPIENMENMSSPVRHTPLKNPPPLSPEPESLPFHDATNTHQHRKEVTPVKQQSQKGSSDNQFEYESVRTKLITQRQVDHEDQLAMILFNGATFQKVGKFGSAKPKFVVCSQDGVLFWSDAAAPNKTLSNIKLINVKEILIGKQSSNFRRQTAKTMLDEQCFSLVSDGRTVDLQAETQELRDSWVQALTWACENVQTLGKVCKQPISTTELERKERSYENAIQALQSKLEETKKIITVKNQELGEREQTLLLERRNSQSEIEKRDATLQEKSKELDHLEVKKTELEQNLQKIRHERQLSRQIHAHVNERMEDKMTKMEKEKKELKENFEQEKTQLQQIIKDSQNLLSKAKETIHKRQMSRTDRLASYAALEAEVAELKKKNTELKREAQTAKAMQKQTLQQIEKAREIVKSNKFAEDDLDSELDKLLPMATSAEEPVVVVTDDFGAEGKEEEENDESATKMAVIREESLVESEDAKTTEDKQDQQPAMPTVPAVPDTIVPFSDVQSPTKWHPDHDHTACESCQVKFTFFLRRHHCRLCARCVCNSCSQSRVKVEETTEKVRVCTDCFDNVNKKDTTPVVPEN